MIREIVRDAIHLKMKAKEESPLISVYEFCYAAGLGLNIMGVPVDKAEAWRKEEDFLKFKAQIQNEVKESDAFEAYPNGERLKNLIVGCRVGGSMSQDARILFDMGFQGGSR